ncbi:type II secretion system protein [Candidatus Kaiserbacteria bacterium]|nr:MAG: type II secretion system protein [Candidatus Kaiserbacteria bacterium]
MCVLHNKNGFTLIETIIYVGLFGIICSGIFVSIYPFFTGAERLSRNITNEDESSFILAKIRYALINTITTPQGVITTPGEGETSDTLVLEQDRHVAYIFTLDTGNAFCTPPLICSQVTLMDHGKDPLPLNASRVTIDNITFTHHAPVGDAPRSLEVSFRVGDIPVGPIRYYLHF